MKTMKGRTMDKSQIPNFKFKENGTNVMVERVLGECF